MSSNIEYGLRLIGIIQRVLLFLLAPLFWISRQKQTKKIPPISSDLLLKSATYLAKNIRERKIKSEDVVRAYIKRIEEVNPNLNGVVQDCFTTALETARSIDEYIPKRTKEQLEKEQPLLGVPFTVKETCMVSGVSHTALTKSREGHIAEKDGYAVSLIRKAGGIPLAVTNTPEMCLNWETNNLMVGRTLNPYNTNYTPGGSSGGEGALITAAGSLWGLGSDIAGSIRVPAAFSGIFGHKPTPRVVPVDGHVPTCTDEAYFEYFAIGPLTRYAEDMKLMMQALDYQKVLNLDAEVDTGKLNVYFKETAGESICSDAVSDEIKLLIRQAASYLQRTGCKVAPATFVDMNYALEIGGANFALIQDMPNLLQSPDNPKESRNIYFEMLKSVLGLSDISWDALIFQLMLRANRFIPISKLPKYQRALALMKKTFLDNLGTNGIFLYPTFPTSAFQHNQAFMKNIGAQYTMIFNTLGFPATHVPMGLDKNGLPIGIQVVAAPYQDRLCLAVAEKLEKHFGGWVSPSEIKVQKPTNCDIII